MSNGGDQNPDCLRVLQPPTFTSLNVYLSAMESLQSFVFLAMGKALTSPYRALFCLVNHGLYKFTLLICNTSR